MSTSVPCIHRDELLALTNAPRPGFYLVEALPAKFYAQGHLPGALNLPLEEVEALAPTLLPDQAALVVTYCANAPCENSGIAAEHLVRLGYRNVREYVEGKEDWVGAGLPLERRDATSAGAGADPVR